MEGLSQEVLSFLIDIQAHGASQLKALSTDFTTLGASADRISGQLRTMEAQLAKTGATATATGSKIASSQKGATDSLLASAGASEKATAAQRGQAVAADAAAGATDKATGAARAHTTALRGDEAATAAHTSAERSSAGVTAAGASALRGHSAQLNEHGKALEKVKTTTHEFASTMNQVSLPLLAVGGLSIKMGMDFQAAMSRLHTQAGYGVKDVEGLEKSVLKAAPAMRRTPTELADGLYHVASVGIPASQAMKVLEAASIGANVGAADFSATANGLAIVMKNLHQPASKAQEDMGLLNEIVGAGNMHMEELVTSLGKVMPQAQQFGISLRDTGAAMDVMTSRGIDANMAATRLGMTFNQLARPNSTAQKSLDKIGLSSTALAEALRQHGLIGAIGELKQHLDNAFPARDSHALSLDEKRKALEIYTKSLEEAGAKGKTLAAAQQKYAAELSHGGSAAVEKAGVLSEAFGRGRQSSGILMLVQGFNDLRNTAVKRLPEGEAAIHRLMDANTVWEKTSQAHYDHIKASFSAAMTSLGTSIGPPVLGALTTLAEDTQHVAERFEALPKSTKHLIEGFVGLVAIAGPAAGFMSKIAGAGVLIERLKGGGGSIAKMASVGSSGSSLPSVGGITGFFGPEAPGSKINPLAVMVMDPSGGGSPLSPTSASTKKVATTAEQDALKAAEGGAGSIAAGAGGAEALSLAEKARSLLGGALKGGAIGLGGLAASNIAGTLIGGSTGKAVSTIGSDAAIGAGVGSVIPGVGTLGGAAAGAIVGGLKVALSAPSFGDKMASQLAAGMSPGAVKAVKESFDAVHNAQTGAALAARAGGASPSSGPRGVGAAATRPPQHVEISNAAAYAGGAAQAASIEKLAEGFKHMNLDAIFGEFDKKLSAMPARSRSAGVQSIIEWTHGMESQGKLPKGATDAMITDIEKAWPQYASYLHKVGLGSIKELIATMEGHEVTEAAKAQVQAISREWQQLPPLLKKDGGNVTREWGTTLDFLVSQTYSKIPGVSKAAHQELDKMRSDTGKLMTGWASDMAEQFRSAGTKGATEYGKGMTALVASIKSAMHAGLIATQAGDALILSEEKKEATELGSRPETVKGGHAPAGATGMRVPGGGLMDTVPVLGRHGGVRGIVAPGELLIANRHTEARVNEKLAPYGTSLAHEVLGEGRPHSAPMLAKGGALTGFQPSEAYPGPRGRLDQGVDYAGPGPVRAVLPGEVLSTGLWPGWPGTGGIVYSTTRGNVYVMEDFAAAVKRGQKLVAGQMIGTDTGGATGIETGWANAQGTGPLTPYGGAADGTPMPGAKSFASFLGGGPGGGVGAAGGTAAHWKTIKQPKWGGPGGLIGQIGQAVLKKATALANKRGRALAASVGGGAANFAGVPGSGGSHQANEQLGKRMMEAAGWSASEWPALQALWTQESGWDANSVNNSSGAYGIPQSLGHGHPYNLGDARAQIAWGLNYIKGRYGSPGAAEAHERAFNWYAKGGLLRKFAEGGTDEEIVEVPPGQDEGPENEGVETVSPAEAIADIADEEAAEGPAAEAGAAGAAATLAGRAALPAILRSWMQARGKKHKRHHRHRRRHHPHHALGGLAFAGAFGAGGSVTASKPTLALFGENGPETAHFLPHAATGAEIGEGIIEEAPASGKTTEAFNPATNNIESHTAAEWRRIRAQNAKASHDKAKKAAAVKAQTDPVLLGGMEAGTVTDKFAGAIDVSKDAGKLSSELWKKVIAAVSKVIAKTDAGAGVATQLAGSAASLAQHEHGQHTTELARTSITAAGKTVMTVLKNAPETQAGVAGSTALGQLTKLIRDAKISNNKALVTGLVKDEETVIQTTGSRILKLSEAVPPGQAALGASQAVSKLGGLISSANARGLHAVELALEKSAQRAITNWSGAIQSTLSKATAGATARATLRTNLANQALINKTPRATLTTAGPKLGTTATDPQLAKEQSEAAAAAVKQMGAEAHALNVLIKNTEKKEQALLKKAAHTHSKKAKDRLKKQARQVRDEAQELKAQLEEVTVASEEAQASAVAADIEYKQAVAEAAKALEEAQKEAIDKAKEALLATIQTVVEGYEHTSAQLATSGTLAEGKLHREGKDFAGLEEKKSEQEGKLTQPQIEQAQSDLKAFTDARNAQIANDQAQQAYDQSQVGGLTGSDKTNMESAIDNLANSINSLENEIFDQTKATKKLTEATEAQTKAYGGTVGFSFNGQQYAAGDQSSNSASNIMNGV